MYVVKIFDENATGDIDSLIMGLQWVLDRDIRGALPSAMIIRWFIWSFKWHPNRD
ncbi:hypothetical protein DENIS_3922 [Desulfonema ishimotonii]|uniref:Uncharacterized protein n=1 Tax=Desulfonema ishimotonii TaxID=45657 RepID=A0A401G125_9BACT|nr:hypothetical protein [Desulfonema ishimotonii]GBC62938.1 hypothetical protein DENIS_3922 [Desulfonema ishimotonii]